MNSKLRKIIKDTFNVVSEEELSRIDNTVSEVLKYYISYDEVMKVIDEQQSKTVLKIGLCNNEETVKVISVEHIKNAIEKLRGGI